MTKTIRMTVAQAIVKRRRDKIRRRILHHLRTWNCSRTWRSAGYKPGTVESPAGKKRTGNVPRGNRICKAE